MSTMREPETSLVTIIYFTYALFALGLAIAPFAANTRLGDLLFGWPPLIAMIVNFAKQASARGTWLESHFRWQMRTVWIAVAWALLAAIVTLAGGLTEGFTLWRVAIYALGFWATYRLVRGLLRLRQRQPMPG